MEFIVVEHVLKENMDLLDRATNGIRQCLPAYEKKCSEIISNIGTSQTLEDSEAYFEELHRIQERLATLLFKHRFEIGDKLECLTREFDRLYDPYIRQYWFEKFKAGVIWPCYSSVDSSAR